MFGSPVGQGFVTGSKVGPANCPRASASLVVSAGPSPDVNLPPPPDDPHTRGQAARRDRASDDLMRDVETLRERARTLCRVVPHAIAPENSSE